MFSIETILKKTIYTKNAYYPSFTALIVRENGLCLFVCLSMNINICV